MLRCLTEQELDQSDADLGFFAIKLLVAAQLDQLLVIIGLTLDLLDHLGEHKLELNC